MRKKYSVFKEKFPHIQSMLDQGYPYGDVILDLNQHHELNLSFNTFRSYLYRYRKTLHSDITSTQKSKEIKSDSLAIESTQLEKVGQTFTTKSYAESGAEFIAKHSNNP